MKLATIVASALLMTGCASGSKFQDTTLAEAEPENTRVFFYRPSAFSYAIKPTVFLDGEAVGKIEAKGFFFVDVDQGTYTVGTDKNGKYITEIATFNEEVVYVKVKMKTGIFKAHAEAARVPEEVGRKEITKTKYQN